MYMLRYTLIHWQWVGNKRPANSHRTTLYYRLTCEMTSNFPQKGDWAPCLRKSRTSTFPAWNLVDFPAWNHEICLTSLWNVFPVMSHPFRFDTTEVPWDLFGTLAWEGCWIHGTTSWGVDRCLEIKGMYTTKCWGKGGSFGRSQGVGQVLMGFQCSMFNLNILIWPDKCTKLCLYPGFIHRSESGSMAFPTLPSWVAISKGPWWTKTSGSGDRHLLSRFYRYYTREI